MNGGTELVHGDEPGRIDGLPARGETCGIARAASVGTAVGAPAGGGFCGGHFEGRGEPARHDGGGMGERGELGGTGFNLSGLSWSTRSTWDNQARTISDKLRQG